MTMAEEDGDVLAFELEAAVSCCRARARAGAQPKAQLPSSPPLSRSWSSPPWSRPEEDLLKAYEVQKEAVPLDDALTRSDDEAQACSTVC